jgi:outer membrane lipoprotein-sorting protein
MSQPRRFSRRARWAVPAGVAAIVGLVAGGTLVSAAQAAPALPARSAAQLLTDVQRAAATAPRPVTATIQESAALGLPDLPDMGSVSSGLSLLSGSHTVKVWYADPVHVRLAEQVPMGETDLRVDGSRVWLWQSSSQTATHLLLPARSAAPGPLGKSSRPAAGKAAVELTPQQATQRVLAAVGPTTAVSVQQNVTVAGQPAYELRLAPKDSGSLIGQIDIDIDAANYLPLQLQVLARGAVTPAFQVGYTALSFGRPAAGNFTFSPPPGAKVKTVTAPAVPAVPAVPRRGKHSAKAPQAASSVRVVGKNWLSVAVVPASASLAALANVAEGAPATSSSSFSSSSNGSAYSSTFVAGNSQELAALRMLLRASTPVHGAWGSGRLLRTSLVSVLLTRKGEVLVGAVRPAVLYADVAQVK